MIIKSAEFLMSNSQLKGCPKPTLPEYAFIGRSNVGKSSLINMLVNKKDLAKTSAQPGKTRLINHFFINGNWYLVDLPGYGYAKVSKTDREKWQTYINNYLAKRENLMCLFILIDSRIEPQKSDMEFIEKVGEAEIPFVLVFTKTDKLGKEKIKLNIEAFKAEMQKTWDELPQLFVTSAVTKEGHDEILDFIEKTNKLFTY